MFLTWILKRVGQHKAKLFTIVEIEDVWYIEVAERARAIWIPRLCDFLIDFNAYYWERYESSI